MKSHIFPVKKFSETEMQTIQILIKKKRMVKKYSKINLSIFEVEHENTSEK